jgi:hypothetical protein
MLLGSPVAPNHMILEYVKGGFILSLYLRGVLVERHVFTEAMAAAGEISVILAEFGAELKAREQPPPSPAAAGEDLAARIAEARVAVETGVVHIGTTLEWQWWAQLAFDVLDERAAAESRAEKWEAQAGDLLVENSVNRVRAEQAEAKWEQEAKARIAAEADVASMEEHAADD